MYPNLVLRVVDFLNEARAKYPCDVDRNGEITYANGNDGTDFDWQCNDRLCEFGWGVPDGSVWAFKCLVGKNGTADIFCYPNGEAQPIDTITKKLFDEDEARRLFATMYKSTDKKGLWDASLCDIDWVTV